MLRTCIAAALLMCATFAAAGQPSALPTRALTGDRLVIPEDLPGRPSLLIVGFSRDSKSQTAAWSKRIEADPQLKGSILTYRVITLEDVPSPLRGFVTRSIRKEVPEPLQGSFLVVTEQTDAWKQWLAFSSPDAAYMALLDAGHQVVWRAVGELTDTLFQALQLEVAKLNGGA